MTSLISRIVKALKASLAVSVSVGIVTFDRYTTEDLELSPLLPWGSRAIEARRVMAAAEHLNLTSRGGPTLLNPALVAVRTQLADVDPDDDDDADDAQPPPLVVIFSDGDSLNQHKVGDEIKHRVHNSTRRLFVNIGKNDVTRDSSTLFSLLEQDKYAEENVAENVANIKLDCLSNEGKLASRFLNLMVPPYQVLCEGTTRTATTSTTTTSVPCTAVDDDDAIAARATELGFRSGLLSCSTAPPTFCDAANELGRLLHFRSLCGSACGLCIHEPTTTTTTPKITVPIAVYSMDLALSAPAALASAPAACSPASAEKIAAAMVAEFVRRGFAQRVLSDVGQWCSGDHDDDFDFDADFAYETLLVVGIHFSSAFAANAIETFAAPGIAFVVDSKIYLTRTVQRVSGYDGGNDDDDGMHAAACTTWSVCALRYDVRVCKPIPADNIDIPALRLVNGGSWIVVKTTCFFLFL